MAAEKSRRFRLKNRDNEDFKEKEILRKRIQRLEYQQNPEKMATIREQARIRQARYREKRRLLNDENNPPVAKKRKVITRKEHNTQKEKSRGRKRKWRESLNPQQKRRLKEKNRLYQATKRSKKKIETSNEIRESDECSANVSKSAIKQASYRSRKAMPKCPQKFAQVTKHILANATAEQKEAFKDHGIAAEELTETVKSMRSCVKYLNVMKTEEWRRMRCRVLSSMKCSKRARKSVAKNLGINYKTMLKMSKISSDERAKRKDALAPNILEAVENHFMESSSFVPDMKSVKKSSLQPVKVLSQTVRELYKGFQTKRPDINISLSTFCKHKPKNIQTSNKKKLYQSLCPTCTNARYLLKAYNKECVQLGKDACKIDGLSDLVSKSTCPREPGNIYHPILCIERNCNICSVGLLEQHVEDLMAVSEKEIAWQYWCTAEISRPNSDKPIKKKVLKVKTGSLRNLVDEMKELTKMLAYHMFVASWQKKAFTELIKEIPKGAVVGHLDFSENYSTFYQEEISSAHWMKNMITVHPSVFHYNCSQCPEGSAPVMDAHIFLSDDNTHDYHAVQEFTRISIGFLREQRCLDILKWLEFTDGCAGQYKSKHSMVDLSFANDDFGVKRERHYFESYHGKGPSDGAGAVVKMAVRRAVLKQNIVIQNAHEMFSYLNEHFSRPDMMNGKCNHSRRTFFLVNGVNRNRKEREIKTTLKGTRELHAVRSISPGLVCSRKLSCICTSCYGEDEGECPNAAYVKDWNVRRLNLKATTVPRVWHRNGEESGL